MAEGTGCFSPGSSLVLCLGRVVEGEGEMEMEGHFA